MSKNDYSKTRNDRNASIFVPDYNDSFQKAAGKIPYNMTNDYMFRAVLQANNKALRGLICSLLHLSEAEVDSVAITNPIVLGESVNNKEFRLDIHLLLNDSTHINLEMQITNRLNWQNRSVMYLCRTYDKLNRGQDYRAAKPAVHIGFLDYTLFAEHPEFYAAYKLINVKKHHIYSNSLTLYVADLTRIDLATEEDKQYHIDRWAKLFKADTWEELRMVASEDEALYEAAKTLFYQSSDEEIRMRCLDREEYYQDLRNYERKIEQDRLEHEQDLRNYERKIEQDRLEHEQDLRNYERKIEQDRQNYKKALARKSQTISAQTAEIERLRAELARLKS